MVSEEILRKSYEMNKVFFKHPIQKVQDLRSRGALPYFGTGNRYFQEDQPAFWTTPTFIRR